MRFLNRRLNNQSKILKLVHYTWSCDNAELVPLPFEGSLAARRAHPASLVRSGYRRERSLLLEAATPPIAESSMLLRPLMLNVSLRCPVPESNCHFDVLMTLYVQYTSPCDIGNDPACSCSYKKKQTENVKNDNQNIITLQLLKIR